MFSEAEVIAHPLRDLLVQMVIGETVSADDSLDVLVESLVVDEALYDCVDESVYCVSHLIAPLWIV